MPDTSPTITQLHTYTATQLRAAVTGLEPMRDHTGRTFQPTRVTVRWEDGVLTRASIQGPRLTADGRPYAGGQTSGRSYISAAGVLLQPSEQGPGAPDWLRQLVTRHAPTPAATQP